jgi:hypothetical protein
LPDSAPSHAAGDVSEPSGRAGAHSPTAAVPAGGSALGPALEPVLIAATEGRLSAVRWFRSDWQRGGGSTGLATLRTARGEREVVVKLPVGGIEHRWTTGLSRPEPEPAGPTPRVFEHGLSLGGYDLAWLVMERLPGAPLAGQMNEQAVRDLVAAADAFHHAAGAVAPVDPSAPRTPEPDWEKAVAKSREVAKRGVIAEAQKWNSTLKDVHRLLPTLAGRWSHRPINTWCHGDLHAGNALRRVGGAAGVGGAGSGVSGGGEGAARGCVLIDLALVHPGHWIEDALYLERVFWGRPEGLCGVNPVTHLAALRREAGHHNTEDYALLANTRRVLSAAAAPGMLEREGNAKYLHHALELIQRLLGAVH